ncbi:MAG: hypothetical protein ACOX2O_03605 [Bdellovibrionota bacterium]|jgi:hypothetical protein
MSKNRVHIFFYIFLINYFSLFAPYAAAQTHALSQEEIAALAKQLQLDVSSRHMQRIISSTPYEPPSNDYPTKVIKHIRGNGKGRFPTQAEYEKEFRTLWEKAEQEAALNRDTEEELEEGDIFSVSSGQEEILGDCPKSLTERTVIADKDSPNADTVVYDILWLKNESQLPKDLVAAFGENTVVRYYRPFSPDAPTKTAVGLGVNCLPTRIRATNSVVFKDEGLNALLNYDKNFYGRGVLHPSMKEILEKK